jgi:ABC-type branched-subunit amino acid transport system ATPase component
MAEALVIQNLSKRFGGLRAVQDVSFSVREGETLALIGPNGAGKTTSFNLITGFHRPDSGSVLAFGRELVGLRPHDVCTHGLARTFQVARPFGRMTVLANVMTGAFLRSRKPEIALVDSREVASWRWRVTSWCSITGRRSPRALAETWSRTRTSSAQPRHRLCARVDTWRRRVLTLSGVGAA